MPGILHQKYASEKPFRIKGEFRNAPGMRELFYGKSLLRARKSVMGSFLDKLEFPEFQCRTKDDWRQALKSCCD
jgi:hypothetical protein